MDDVKCRALKAELSAQSELLIVPVARFFDGNDDLGSIGCNLDPHPGVEKFRNVLTGLLGRRDVKAVYAQISELDPGDGYDSCGRHDCRRRFAKSRKRIAAG
jgi:hypothetical protein